MNGIIENCSTIDPEIRLFINESEINAKSYLWLVWLVIGISVFATIFFDNYLIRELQLKFLSAHIKHSQFVSLIHLWIVKNNREKLLILAAFRAVGEGRVVVFWGVQTPPIFFLNTTYYFRRSEFPKYRNVPASNENTAPKNILITALATFTAMRQHLTNRVDIRL